MTTDDGLKGLTDEQITAFFDYVDDERGNAAKAHYKSADSDKSWESKRTGIIANAARAWLAANVRDSWDGVDENAVFRMACWLAERDGCDDVHHLIWEGSPPEPWGEVWHKYEDDARRALKAAILAGKGEV